MGMYVKFAQLLQEREIKAADVTRGTGLPSRFFSDWKSGRGEPKADKIKILCDYFGVPMSYFYGETKSQKVEEITALVAGLTEEQQDLLLAFIRSLK